MGERLALMMGRPFGEDSSVFQKFLGNQRLFLKLARTSWHQLVLSAFVSAHLDDHLPWSFPRPIQNVGSGGEIVGTAHPYVGLEPNITALLL